MISEKQLIGNYASFWRTLTPTSDLFVRKLNLELYERDAPPSHFATKPDRRGFINEIAFDLFCIRSSSPGLRISDKADHEQAIKSVMIKMQEDKVKDLASEQPVTEPERLDINWQANTIQSAISSRFPKSGVTLRPRFRGCGFLSPCNADLHVDDCLIEIKAGERPFRSIDIRQILVYCALNQLDGTFRIARIGLMNPRQGTSFFSDIEAVCREVSGSSSYELLTAIIERLSSGGISR